VNEQASRSGCRLRVDVELSPATFKDRLYGFVVFVTVGATLLILGRVGFSLTQSKDIALFCRDVSPDRIGCEP
jgi:hypothetical protein